MKHLLSILFIALFSITLGCQTPRGFAPSYATPELTVPVCVDASFSDQQKVDILKAVDIWNSATPGMHKFDVRAMECSEQALQAIEDSQYGLAIINDDDEDMIAEGALAYVDGLRGHHMFIESKFMGTRDWVSVVMHELGHAIGLPHIPIAGTLMAPSVQLHQPNSCIDEVTARELVTIRPRDFRLDKMVYCKIPE